MAGAGHKNLDERLLDAHAKGKRIITKIAAGDLARLLGDDDEREKIYRKIFTKDDFHKRRWRCLTKPERALETLGPYARLELTIQCGKNLLPRESWTTMTTTDPRVFIYLDDMKLEGPGMRTLVVRQTMNPLWRHQASLDIVSPLSMVRLQVCDDQVTHMVDQGFVEICVGDMPYNTPIRGWLELRFQDNLKNTSVKRYASHCALREEELEMPDQVEHTATALQAGPSESSLPMYTVTKEELKGRKMVAVRALQKTRTMLHSCSHGCVKKAGFYDSRGPSAANEAERSNAGELYVEMKLVRLGSSLDSKFALALPMPTPMHYGHYVLPEDEEVVAAKREKKALDMQNVMDAVTDMRIRFFEDFACCIYYYVKYIGTWRTPVFSFPIFVCCVLCCFHAYYAAVLMPLLLSLALFLNGWDSLRKIMTRGGWNASMTEEGFTQVAKWRSSSEMVIYLKRIVENDLSGTVTNMQKLKLLAAQCFRDGVPTVSLQELRITLKTQKDLLTVDMGDWHRFKKDDKVMVDERFKATVLSTTDEGKVMLVYDDDEVRSPRGQTANLQSEMAHPLEPDRIRHRQKLPFYQSAWFLPTKLTNALRDIMETWGQLETSQVIPILDVLTEIVTWKRKGPALLICTALVLFAVPFIFVEIDYEEPGEQFGAAHAAVSWWLITIIRNLDNLICLVVVFVVLILNANWFQIVKAVLRVLSRIGAEKRSAPRHWAFFREDRSMQSNLDIIETSAQWKSLANFQELSANLKNMPEKLRTAGETAMADIDALQKRLALTAGLTNFKLPDLSHPSNRLAST